MSLNAISQKKYKILEKNISCGNFWCYFTTFTTLFFLQFQNRPTLTSNYPFWTSEHFPALADTSPKPATTYPTNNSLVLAVQTCSSD